MQLENRGTMWLLILLMNSGIAVKINLLANTSWDENAVTVAGWTNGTNGSLPSQLNRAVAITIGRDDILYVADKENHRIVVVYLDSVIPNLIIGSGLGSGLNQFAYPYKAFPTNSSLYITDVGNNRIKKQLLNGSNPNIVLNLPGSYTANYLFIDSNDEIYFTSTRNHTVILFHENSSNITIVAGTGVQGSGDNQLNAPYGLFVNQVGTIYVADCSNHRIMKWHKGASIGIRVAGDGNSGAGSTHLNGPTDVIVDSNEYMYISESFNSRITRWPPNSMFGVCIAACTGVMGTASTQLYIPHSLAFDSHGSLYVTDYGNNRVQKFSIIKYSNPSYNQPRLSSCATWNPNATTFVNSSFLVTQSYGIFVNVNNTIYVANYGFNQVQIWLEGSTSPIRNITTNLIYPHSIFVTSNGDIYVDDGHSNYQVDKWTSDTNSSVIAMVVNSICHGLFVDIIGNLYCSMGSLHLVIKRSFSADANKTVIVAGNGNAGSTSFMLNEPRGIFINENFNLYVADCQNNRIQRFSLGQLNGTTVVETGTASGITLACPTSVVLDADGYLFIVNSQQHQIIGQSQSGFRCIVGCHYGAGVAANQLNEPWTISFDSYGNLYVTDMMNARIQKFSLVTQFCNVSTMTTTQRQTSINDIGSTIGGTTTSIINTNTLHILTSSIETTVIPITSVGITSSSVELSSLSSNVYSYSTSVNLRPKLTNTPCHMLQPCQNDGTCNNTNTTVDGYICLCQTGFQGVQCQYNDRSCKPNTCWNNGYCIDLSNTSFICLCTMGWNGVYCETKVNYCHEIQCLNSGVCRSLLNNYSCECLRDSYSGRHCEITVQQITNYKIISKSFAYVAILAISSLFMFVIIMDLLKYCFGIDPVTRKSKPIIRKKKSRPIVVHRFTYINTPTTLNLPTVPVD